jgi:hypothetical protein
MTTNTRIAAYNSSIPVFTHMLTALKTILEKAQVFEAEKNIHFTTLPNMRLAADMLPLTKQVQIACDNAKGCAARLAGVENPKWDDHEASLSDLVARVDKTMAFLATFKAEQFAGCEDKTIEIKAGPRELKFTGIQYQLYFATPNVYFHITTAYNILRHAGVSIGKRDFLGG